MAGTEPSCMGDGPNGQYPVCRVGYAQDDGLRGSREGGRGGEVRQIGIFESRRLERDVPAA
jgi:hypothetical protein